MFSLFFNKQKVIDKAKNEIYGKFQKQKEDRETEDKNISLFIIQEQLNKLVICVSNEVQNPIVGYGKEVIFITKANIPQLVVYDIVNNCEVMPFGKVFTYTEQKFHALNSLEANERIAIIYNQYEDSEINKNSTMPEEKLFHNDIWSKKVKEAIKVWENK